MAGDGAFQIGAGPYIGPAPEAVAAMAVRLDGICQEMADLRLQLAQVALVNWRSPAAAAFREELADRDGAMVAAIRAADKAVTEIDEYGRFLTSNSTSSSNSMTPAGCLNPAFQWQPGPTFGGVPGGSLQW